MKTFVIPTIYTAVDKMSGPYRTMAGNAAKFNSKIAQSERLFNKLTPSVGKATKDMISFATSGAVLIGLAASAKAVTDYEDSVASFRTIVSELNDKEFAKYQTQIDRVAKKTHSSGAAVASAFEKIAGLQSTFADTAEGLGIVSRASITLAQASGMELGPAAESLVGIMNQFNLKAHEATRVMDVLASGQAIGASSIAQTAEAYVNFGSTAAASNATVEQSTALIQTLAEKSLFGAEAGTALRGAFIRLQSAGLGFASGQFKINDALDEARANIDKLKTAEEKAALVRKYFGIQNATAGQILMNNLDTYKRFEKGVVSVGEAQRQADIKNKTLTRSVEMLRDSFYGLVTGSGEGKNALSGVTSVVQFLNRHLETIISVTTKVIGIFLVWKALIIASKTVMALYNIALGVNVALGNASIMTLRKSALAMTVFSGVTKSVTAAQWLWNAALTANPIGLIVVGVAALIAVIVMLGRKFSDNWGMITEAFKSGGILGGIKAIGKVILDFLLAPIQAVIGAIADFTGASWAVAADAKIEQFRNSLGVKQEPESEPDKKPVLLNKAKAQNDVITQTMQSTNNARVDMFINDPNNRTTAKSDAGFINIKTGKTVFGG